MCRRCTRILISRRSCWRRSRAGNEPIHTQRSQFRWGIPAQMNAANKSGICALILGIFILVTAFGSFLIYESIPFFKREQNVFLSGVRQAMEENAKDYPGKKQFLAANANIFMYGGGDTAFGNSTEATRLAGDFSTVLEQRCQKNFTGGSRFNPTTGDHFLTYCRFTSGEIVFLCHVPDLISYRGNIREMLAGVAWSSAWYVAESEKIKPGTPMVIGLSGFPGYGPIWEGKVGAPPTIRGEGLDEEKRLYPYFIDGR
jgi:hypothetical protein